MKKSFSTIVFDWSGVFCLPGELFSHKVFRNFGSLDSVNLETQDIQKEYYIGKISSEEFWARIISYFKLDDITPMELNDAYLASPIIWQDMLAIAFKIKQQFQTILFSNLTHEMMQYIIQKYSVPDYFHYTVFSNKIGLMKPDARAFKYVIDIVEKPSCDILFIDDSKSNIESADRLGFQTYLFTNVQTFVKDFYAD